MSPVGDAQFGSGGARGRARPADVAEAPGGGRDAGDQRVACSSVPKTFSWYGAAWPPTLGFTRRGSTRRRGCWELL